MGNFQNDGRSWRREDCDALDRDPPSLVQGRTFPYDIYDENRNASYVVIGTPHQTAALAVATIHEWWQKVERHRCPGVSRLAIEADSASANGNRC